MIELLNVDCMEYMETIPDHYFDLAVVDPPYGINVGVSVGGGKSFNGNRRKKIINPKVYTGFDDCQAPDKKYFIELMRISKHQIIFGGNYFVEYLKRSSCWIVWDKQNSGDFADCELAWTNFKTAVRKYSFKWNGMLQGDMKNKEYRIHPTQKPVKLYQWLLKNYAESGQKIFDSHLGSGSSAIAAHYFGCDFIGCEIDKVIYQSAVERFNYETRQMALL